MFLIRQDKTERKEEEKMKKAIKRFMTAALAGAMVLSMSAFPSFAVQGNDGEIVITNPDVDVTYSAYKIFDMDYTAATADDDAYYVYTIKDNSDFYQAVKEYAEQTDDETSDNDPDGLTLIKVGDAVNDVTTYNVIIDKSKFSAVSFGSSMKAVVTKEGSAVKADATENDSETAKDLTLSDSLPYGYYMVVGTTTAEGVTTAESLVSLDSTNTTAEIVEKNSTPGWHSDDPKNPDVKGKTIKITENGETKYVETADLSIGDEVTFSIQIDAKNYVGKNLVKNYIIRDNMPEGFTFEEIKSVTVTDSTSHELKTTDTTYTYTNNSFPSGDTGNNEDGSIVIPWATGSDEAGWISIYDPSAVITIEYTATLDSDAVIDGAGNVNTAAFTYEYGKTPENPNPDPDPEDPTDPSKWTNTDTAKVYTYAIAIKKINKSGTPLAGATFKLPDGLTVSHAVDDNGNQIANTYVVDKESGMDSITTAGEDASFTIIGLAAGDYELTETKAPDKYNVLTSPVKVTAQKIGETATTTSTTIYIDADGNISKTETDVAVTYENDDYAVTPYAVVNFTGTELPSTGGIGTTMFYVIGIICVAGAVVLLVTKRRMTVR